MKLSYILNSYTRGDIHLMSSLTSRQKFCLHNQFANSPRLLNSERDYSMNLVDLDKNHSNLDMNKPHNILVQPGVDLLRCKCHFAMSLCVYSSLIVFHCPM